MSTLMFACPNTRQPIMTGIAADDFTLTCLGPIKLRVRCVHCGTDHELRMKYGVLVDDAGVARSRRNAPPAPH